ncbi:MAG: 3'(2'),5'-bisphosphate nucleotidase CysQ [Campylobacterales bacterium]|nr:3'(2'),5'-bisphosphate nucleotidase CysQ [Campylobacterales bacterium]
MVESVDIQIICQIAKKAGAAIMGIYNQDFEVDFKQDNSLLTQADLKANEIICLQLQKLYPHVPILSEENFIPSYDIRKKWEYFWCIDPLDGTKEFVNKNSEFTVNIALIHKQTPVLGVVYVPVFDDIYYAKKSFGAFKNGLKLPLDRDDGNLIFAVSRSHMNAQTKKFIDEYKTSKNKTTVSMGSSLKLCLCAQGAIDIVPRFGPSMIWDTAASDAILQEVGKRCYNFESKKSLQYNIESLQNPDFVAF